jgi:DNA polymerase III epsilon subunit-like protein
MAIPSYLMGDVLCLDTETAILGDRVCEIGLSQFRNGQLAYEWGMLVNPGIPIESGASEVHKIYDSDVENAPRFHEIGWAVYNAINAADVVVAYNYEYDRKVLGEEFKRMDAEWPARPAVDPFILFKQYNKYNKGKTLIKAAEKYGISYVGAHRACNDATVAGKVLIKMAATKTNFPKTLEAMLKKQRQWVELQYIDFSKYRESKGLDPIDKPDYALFEEPMKGLVR